MPTIEPVGGAPHACRTQRLVAVGLATRHNLVAELSFGFDGLRTSQLQITVCQRQSNSVRFVNLGMTARKDGTPVGGWFCLQVQINKTTILWQKQLLN